MASFIVRAKSDGRGMIRPFGTYSKAQGGSTLKIGNKTIKVTPDGRANIPKSFMEKYGVAGKDGRKRLLITFKTEPRKKGGPEHWKKVFGRISQPRAEYKNMETGTQTRKFKFKQAKELQPSDTIDQNWSPV